MVRKEGRRGKGEGNIPGEKKRGRGREKEKKCR